MKNGAIGCYFARIVVTLLACVFVADTLASPRVPCIPVPDIVPLTYYEQFDESYSWGITNSAITCGDFTLVQSWSGYALDRSGSPSFPFLVDGVDSSGHTNIPNSGALRFWITPYWASATVSGGSGPGSYARLAVLNSVTSGGASPAWSLEINPDGSTIALIGFSGTTPTLLFQTNIAWTAGSAHCVTLNYGTNSELYLDGQLSAIGAGTTPVQSGSAEMTLGSAFDGGELAQAAFDELSISSRRMNAEQVAFYFGVLADQAALGPISPEEDAAHAAFLAARGSHSSQFSSFSSAFSMSTLSSSPACDGSGALLMTNIASAYVGTNQGWIASFDVIGGGSTGTLWEVWGTTNLATASWSYLTYTHTCSTVTLSNQPPGQAFYMLVNGDITSHDGYGTPDAWYLGHGLNPLIPGIGDADANGDGIANWQEYIRGTDPTASTAWAVWIGTPSGLSNLP